MIGSVLKERRGVGSKRFIAEGLCVANRKANLLAALYEGLY